MIAVVVTEEEGQTLEQNVEADLRKFEAWFKARGDNEQLVRSEIAILKTYLYYKAKEDTDAKGSS